MQDPHNLRVYGEAVTAYKLTATFPRDERYVLISQARRAAVSVGGNIAEGCGRSGNRALCAFLHNAMGSASELAFHRELAIELNFCDGVFRLWCGCAVNEKLGLIVESRSWHLRASRRSAAARG